MIVWKSVYVNAYILFYVILNGLEFRNKKGNTRMDILHFFTISLKFDKYIFFPGGTEFVIKSLLGEIISDLTK